MINIKNKNLYYIGGVVRDEILGKESFDIDITYEGDAIEFCKRLEANGEGKILQTNPQFGTARMLIQDKCIDIASTRNEVYEKKGHLPTVTEIGCTLKKDVLRRDFTINSLAKSTDTGEIIDYTGGLKDIKSKTLRVLHDKSFIDDPTRIIRGLKFAVRFGFKLDNKTEQLQKEYLENINYDMSYKRLKKEIIETFNLNSQEAFNRFNKNGIYKLLAPKYTHSAPIIPCYNIEELIKKYPVSNVWIVYMGCFDLSLLPLTKEEKKIIDDVKSLMDTDIKGDDYSIHKAFDKKSRESILIYTVLTNSKNGLRYFEIENIKVSITGEDLKRLGIEPSPRYAECFDYILEKKLQSPGMPIEEEFNIAKEFFREF